MGLIQRQGFKGMIGTYIGFVLGYVNLLVLYPYFLNPEQIGLMRVFIDLGLLLGTLSLFGTSASMNRFFPVFKERDPERLSGMFSFFMLIVLVGTSLVCLAFYFNRELFIGLFGKNMPEILPFFMWVIPSIGLNALIYLMEGLAAIKGRITIPVFAREVVLRICYAGLVFLYAQSWIDFETLLKLIPGILLLQLVILLVYASRLRISLSFDFMFFVRNRKQVNDFLKYSLFLLVSVLTGIFINKIDFFMLSSMKGARTTGVYTIAYYIGIVVSIPIRNLKQIARPIVADLISQNDKEGLGKIYRDASINMILLGSLIFQIIWFNIDTVFEIMPNGDLFSEGKSIVFIISMAYLIQVSLGVGEMILSFSRYYVYGLLYSFLSIVVAIISNKLLIPNYGMQGAALGTLITCFISIGVIVGVNYLKGQLFPFDRRSIYAILLMVVFLLLDLLLSFGPQMLVVNGLKSVVFLAAFMFIAYRLELSTQLNSFSRKVFLRLGIKLGEKE